MGLALDITLMMGSILGMWLWSGSRGVVLDTASEGPHSLFVLFVQIKTRFVQIVIKNT